ncbi:RNA cytidine acetyltransferase NAT10,tRNA(Met) cytidine acetyltransferase TmcA, N-terminal,Possible tRNA [Cinara cedri]|uniref:RNA cytidine acetyltransferase n=1 Tax=Cinara cedri TaxID=506608 RepID=A0A5E4N8B3_9HEMI|nr:RNA cytidine acetyltransferase NAT10,tRNA(Met) cytidine acetyltransferase TmcA, N-terminal,Possible tRNA [Cinara cedri]
MVRKKIDNRIRTLIENGVIVGHRTMFVIVGDKGRDQVVILHHMLSKAAVKARPNVLWCYKKELGFSSHRKKRMKSIQHKVKAGKLNVNEDDPFELFVASTNIRYCYYSETQKILGNTYGMCVLQDFEAFTPNLLARTIETVEGGGLVVFLLQSLKSLKQLYTLTMDVHERFRTEAHQDVVARFNERFMLSLVSCDRCLVVDDQLTVLPISSKVLELIPEKNTNINSVNDQELAVLKENMKDTQPVGCLVSCCKTVDQAKSLLTFIEAISEKTLRSTVSLTASRGRGKSAALGIAVAAAVAFGYSNIFVTSPSPENLKTFFEFIFKGFDALGYQEHLDYGLVRSTNPDDNKALVRVNIFRDHRQTIQYIVPTDSNKLSQAELVVIDEAAAIPLPLVKAMLGPYLVFLASTINGYEGTGRSLSLKLLQQLRSQSTPIGTNANLKTDQNSVTGRNLKEVTLDESIRYKPGDDVEKWLTNLLCLDSTNIAPLLSGCPPPDSCELYYINRDTLFCYHKASEAFLQRIVSLYVASHYKNSPNDLQMMSDAPAHHLFCLLGPVDVNMNSLPEVLCVIQICLEGEVSQISAADGLKRGKRAAGDLIPWTISGCFQDDQFPSLSGARIVRIATHPDYQSMGYGSRALSLLKMYYEFLIPSLEEGQLPKENIDSIQEEDVDLLEERIEPRNNLPPLLLKLSERPPERLDYIGTSFGLTGPLLKFWKKAGFIPLYIRQTNNELTGEHSCIMISTLNTSDSKNQNWLSQFWIDFRRRFISLLGYQFRKFSPQLALGVLHNTNITIQIDKNILGQTELDVHLSAYDILRLEKYCNNMADYHLIMDLLPTLSKLYFQNKFGDTHFSAVQKALLLGLGLQYKTVEELAEQFDLLPPQLLGLYNRMMRRILQVINGVMEKNVSNEMPVLQQTDSNELRPLAKPLDEELEQAAKVLRKKQRAELEKLKQENLNRYAIKGTEDEWGKALGNSGKTKSVISVKSGEKRLADPASYEPEEENEPKKKKKK